MDTTVDEIMDLLYEDQEIVPKEPLNRKPFIRNDGFGETNRSGKHATVLKNDAEQDAVDSMMKVLNESANEVLEETMNLILAATRMITIKLNKEEETSANEYKVLQNAQGNSSQTVVAKDLADKSFKRSKLVCPAFDENNCRSDLHHQLPCQTLATPKIGNSDSSEFKTAL
ncbi:hypothetical protein H5410_061598 [Solanum commersonii]|uniref:Uncharacterized protein n=1 Tax=Solanum commersonii TaxID=4109 RepID=A0A9J5W9P1_SOLCO|nr:hypothetical protein H5410_061598 [Solanum commersonii]